MPQSRIVRQQWYRSRLRLYERTNARTNERTSSYDAVTGNYDDYAGRVLYYDDGAYDETKNFDDCVNCVLHYDVGNYDGFLLLLCHMCVNRFRPKLSHLQLKPSRLVLKPMLKMVQARGRLPSSLR